MAVSRALRRLLRIREMEEEQSRLALAAALGELNRLEDAFAATAGRDRQGRRLVRSSARSGELPDRLAGLEEQRAATRQAAALAPRIAAMEGNVSALREEFLRKRVERRQVETLLRESEAEAAIETGRRGQQELDDGYGNRMHRSGEKKGRARRIAPAVRPGTDTG